MNPLLSVNNEEISQLLYCAYYDKETITAAVIKSTDMEPNQLVNWQNINLQLCRY